MKPKLRYSLMAASLLGLTLSTDAAPLVVDHTAVFAFTNLTDTDIARVKKLWFSYAGASHSLGVRVGCQLVQSNVDARCLVSVIDSGTPEPYTTNNLRMTRATWGRGGATGWNYGFGEADWYTSLDGINSTKASLAYCATNGPQLDVFGFGWSWQPGWRNGPGGGTNTTHNCQWAGSSAGGPDGDLRCGLTADDFPLTGNHVCMDTYLEATEQYRAFCKTNQYQTTVIFGTAPTDWSYDTGYQTFLKNEHVRNYVSNTVDGVLFDFADILCWDDAGSRKTNAWTDLAGNEKYYEWIAPDNYLNLDGNWAGNNPYHIGERGAIRLGKAVWVMLARITATGTTTRLELDLGIRDFKGGRVGEQVVKEKISRYATDH